MVEECKRFVTKCHLPSSTSRVMGARLAGEVLSAAEPRAERRVRGLELSPSILGVCLGTTEGPVRSNSTLRTPLHGALLCHLLLMRILCGPHYQNKGNEEPRVDNTSGQGHTAGSEVWLVSGAASQDMGQTSLGEQLLYSKCHALCATDSTCGWRCLQGEV